VAAPLGFQKIGLSKQRLLLGRFCWTLPSSIIEVFLVLAHSEAKSKHSENPYPLILFTVHKMQERNERMQKIYEAVAVDEVLVGMNGGLVVERESEATTIPEPPSTDEIASTTFVPTLHRNFILVGYIIVASLLIELYVSCDVELLELWSYLGATYSLLLTAHTTILNILDSPPILN
jgi:hypothetical protein